MRGFFLALVMVFYSLPSLAKDKVTDKKFIFTSVFLAGTTVFDIETTFAALNKCGNTCKESNLLMRPLFKSGRPAVYLVESVVDIGLITWSYKLKKDGNKLWWLPPLAVGTVHGLAGGFNLRFIF